MEFNEDEPVKEKETVNRGGGGGGEDGERELKSSRRRSHENDDDLDLLMIFGSTTGEDGEREWKSSRKRSHEYEDDLDQEMMLGIMTVIRGIRRRRERRQGGSWRHRSRSRSERHHSDQDTDVEPERNREKSRYCEKCREREFREREDRERERRCYKEKKEEVAEPEADPELAYQSLNAGSKAILMQKLDRSGVASSMAGSTGTPAVDVPGLGWATPPALGVGPPLGQTAISAVTGLPGAGLSVPALAAPVIDPIGIPSECLVLENLFNSHFETEAHFDLDIKDDVQKECSKFGAIKHIFVDKYSVEGSAYLRFDKIQSAMNAQRALNGIKYEGRTVKATYMEHQAYKDMFWLS